MGFVYSIHELPGIPSADVKGAEACFWTESPFCLGFAAMPQEYWDKQQATQEAEAEAVEGAEPKEGVEAAAAEVVEGEEAPAEAAEAADAEAPPAEAPAEDAA